MNGVRRGRKENENRFVKTCQGGVKGGSDQKKREMETGEGENGSRRR